MSLNGPLWKDKYRIASARKSDWNYSNAGAYFVTWCVKNKINCLSQIEKDTVELTKFGRIVDEEWHETAQRRNNTLLDAWVVMPSHVHGIIIIEHDAAVQDHPAPSRLFTQSLGAMINQIKSKCTKRIWATGETTFAWQPRFYDRILRNERALNAARNYIANNPNRWELDRNNNAGIFM